MSNSTKLSLSVVYPVYNETELVEETLRRSVVALQELDIDFELIVVDDGSTDETPAILSNLVKEFSFLRVLRNTTNQGQGRSILNGFSIASKEFVIHNGIDYPFDLKHLPKMLALAGKNDIVVAARDSYLGYRKTRLLISKVNRLLVRILFGTSIKDSNFVQLYRTCVVRELPIQAVSTGFITTEMILLAHDGGYRIAQVDIPFEPREKGVSGNSRLSVVVSSFVDLMKFYFRRSSIRKRDKAFRSFISDRSMQSQAENREIEPSSVASRK